MVGYMPKPLKLTNFEITITLFFPPVQVILLQQCCLFCVLSNGMWNVPIDRFS